MLENTSGWIRSSAPGLGKIREIVLSSKEKSGGIKNFCKITDGNHGIYRFPQIIE